MQINKKSEAFTMAEVMILLLTLSIVLAAFAPVMTKRQVNVATDEVWTYVTSDNNYDAYFDNTIKENPAQAFIGVMPNSTDEVTAAVDGKYYSKLVIRASNALKGKKHQNQMTFRYKAPGSSIEAGTKLGGLFAGNGNFLIGADYKDIKLDENIVDLELGNASPTNAYGNTAYGYNALNSITKGQYNTVVGYSAAKNLKDGNYNTVVGSEAAAGDKISNLNYNTYIGYKAGYSANGEYNVYVGSESGSTEDHNTANYNTAVGYQTLSALKEGEYNTVVGSQSLTAAEKANYNTVVGAQSMKNMSVGSYNTAIGYNSCNNLTEESQYKTCIGTNSGSDEGSALPELFKDEHERVFIGSIPKDQPSSASSGRKAAAVLEVHNVGGVNGDSYPINSITNASVVVNGNLIVRGQTYLESLIYRQPKIEDNKDVSYIPRGLVAYKLFDFGTTIKAFAGYDGAKRDKSFGNHVFNNLRSGCICTSSTPPDIDYYKDYLYVNSSGSHSGSTSYDWTTQMTLSSAGQTSSYQDGYLTRQFTLLHKLNPDIGDSFGFVGAESDYAHPLQQAGYTSCCPNLQSVQTSDARLKNITDKYTFGLDYLDRLNIYNYTFKKDKDMMPQVGVIAQDLKKVFPNAVSKDKKGYYHIRWDEMFYALVNSVKTIHSRIEKLSVKIANDRQRVDNLKSSNSKLNAKIDELERELSKLE